MSSLPLQYPFVLESVIRKEILQFLPIAPSSGVVLQLKLSAREWGSLNLLVRTQ